MSPCADWIDNAGLNIALRQEEGEEAIFGSVYSAATWALPQLNDQIEVIKWQGTLKVVTLSEMGLVLSKNPN